LSIWWQRSNFLSFVESKVNDILDAPAAGIWLEFSVVDEPNGWEALDASNVNSLNCQINSSDLDKPVKSSSSFLPSWLHVSTMSTPVGVELHHPGAIISELEVVVLVEAVDLRVFVAG
jgi:hypothetical protein